MARGMCCVALSMACTSPVLTAASWAALVIWRITWPWGGLVRMRPRRWRAKKNKQKKQRRPPIWIPGRSAVSGDVTTSATVRQKRHVLTVYLGEEATVFLEARHAAATGIKPTNCGEWATAYVCQDSPIWGGKDTPSSKILPFVQRKAKRSKLQVGPYVHYGIHFFLKIHFILSQIPFFRHCNSWRAFWLKVFPCFSTCV